MKKSFKKFLALVLAGALLTGTLAACGSKEEEQAPTPTPAADNTPAADPTPAPADTIVDVPADVVPGIDGYVAFDSEVNLRIPVYDRGEVTLHPVGDNFWSNYLQEKFGDQYNIKLEFVPIERWEQMRDYALLAAGGILPTFLMEYDYWRVATWVADGYMTPYNLEEFAFVAPTYYQRMVDSGQMTYTTMQGQTYFALAERPLGYTNYRFVDFVRMDWLREVGYDYVPTGYEDEMKAMQLIKDAGLCDYPLNGQAVTGTGSDQNYHMRGFPMNESEWAMYSSLGIYAMGWEPAKEFLRRENEKYHRGFLHPEYFITDTDTAHARFINGESYIYSDYLSPTMDKLVAFYEQNPGAELAIKPAHMPGGEDSAVYRVDNPFGMCIGFSSQATADEIKAAWMYFEWLSQEENLFEFAWGFEGENHNIVDGVPVAVGDYDGPYKQGNGGNKDYWCVVVEARVVGASEVEDIVAANVPQGLPQDFYAMVLQRTRDQIDLTNQGYGIIDPLFGEVIELEAEYREALSAMYIESRDKLVMGSPDEFSVLYDELSEAYNNAGFAEITAARLALFDKGVSSRLPEQARK
jgi:putative aldouronate transport system substrate-binding protein